MIIKKNFLQIVLTIILSIFVVYIYNNYYKRNNLLYSKPESEEKINYIDNSLEKDVIENVRYVSNNSNGDILKISADSSVPQNKAPHIMFLTNVIGELYFNNQEKINLTSNFAYFNTKSSETNLIGRVKITRADEYITSGELHLVFDLDEETKKKKINFKENYITISKNITIHRPNETLRADVIEINLTSKNFKIFMENENDKVAIETNFN